MSSEQAIEGGTPDLLMCGRVCAWAGWQMKHLWKCEQGTVHRLSAVYHMGLVGVVMYAWR